MDIHKILHEHGLWLRNDAGGSQANLCGADLRGADLCEANLDFASWPLWCGSFGVLVDERMVAQLVAHLTRVVPPEDSAYCKAVFDALRPFADRFVEYRPDVRPIATGAGGHYRQTGHMQ